jgi:hypothetical protein
MYEASIRLSTLPAHARHRTILPLYTVHGPRLTSQYGVVVLTPAHGFLSCFSSSPPRPWLTGPPAAAGGPAHLRGSLGRCLPQTPAKRSSREPQGLEIGGCLRSPRSRSPSARRVCLSHRRCPLTLTRSPVPSPLSATRSVWRGSGGRHLPRLPRRCAGPPAAAGGPVSHGRGGRGESLGRGRGESLGRGRRDTRSRWKGYD